MSCMCGDTHCWSCGPAQGNSRCPACGEWMDDHAEHILGEPACTHQEDRCAAAAEQLAKEEAEYEARMDQLADDYWEVEKHRAEREEAEDEARDDDYLNRHPFSTKE
jgi:hypothetical protein